MANYPPYKYHDIGIAGETLVAQWLQSQDWTILHRRWRCRWGEIDIIAQQDINRSPLLVFVEVKTRSQGNWDAGGRSTIKGKKQTKLWRTAQMFLAKNPEKANYSCRFDVAIVCFDLMSKHPDNQSNSKVLALSFDLEHQLVLQEYITGAFDQIN